MEFATGDDQGFSGISPIKDHCRKIYSNQPKCATKGAFLRIVSGFPEGVWVGIQ
jgi:hypothetical protein